MTPSETDITAVREDIAYLRHLAEGAEGGAQLSGSILVAAAIIFGVANVSQYIAASAREALWPWAPLVIWLVAAALFSIFLALACRRFRGLAWRATTATRAVNAAWSGVGFGIFAIWAGLMAIGLTTGEWSAMMAMPIVVASAYGAAWMVAATVTGRRWMTAVSILAYASAAALGAFMATPAFYLVFACLLVGCALIPGLILMRRPDSATRRAAGAA